MRPIASQIVSICRPSKNMDELLEFALIVDSQELAVSCVLITEECKSGRNAPRQALQRAATAMIQWTIMVMMQATKLR